jgi:hypothetical protein
MKANELVTIWGAPEPPKLTPKQLSIRLPILVAAKISALCELFPKKTKTEIIGDLLTVALEQLQNSFLPVQGEHIGTDPADPEGDLRFEDLGMQSDFLSLTEKQLRELEKEAGIEEPMEFNTFAVTTAAKLTKAR